ncbi:MAG: PEP-CTERM sorting domain-containing protein [Betaproteobacteria bacterium]|nr:PEP-CTERM sorting domain-containing protein [Betaproteobacteria bacterium]
MNARITLLVCILVGAGVSGAAQAALIDRGGGLIYDTDLNVTWLADANYAQTSGYSADGLMDWNQAVTWAANLSYFDAVRNVTYTDWRLPTTTDTGAPGCDFSYSGTDCGYNVDPASSEMAHLYFTELGNLSYFTSTGELSGASAGGANPVSTLDNVGPFKNFQSNGYWSGTESAPASCRCAWFFGTWEGSQFSWDETAPWFNALAVRPGDVAAVPEAQTYALMLAGLGLIGWRARRRG